MKQLVSFFLICLCLLGSISGLQAQQQALLIINETLDKEAKPTLSRMYVTKDKVVVENEDTRQPTTTLYDADKEELYVIDHKKKEYMVMTKADMVAINEQLKAASAQMEEQLKDLPEAQRKMMEEQLAKFPGAQEPLTYKRTGDKVTVKGWNSSKYEGKAKDKLRHEIYIASYKELGQDKEDFKALISLYTLLQNQLQQMSRSLPVAAAISIQSMPGGEDGMPVKSIYYDAQGKPEVTSSINSIEEATLENEKMQVPGNYKKKNFRMENKQ